MAIQFARMEFVSRGGGGNVCRKAAYNKRDTIKDERQDKNFSFKNRDGGVYHEVLLPEGASLKFKDSETLWNLVESFENRRNSRLAKEMVLALPDNKELSLEDRIELCQRFAKSQFVDKGVAVQIDIHSPHHVKDKNWHAHLMITTRRFSETGDTFESKKARDLDGVIRKGAVLEIEAWGSIWKEIQNEYFKEKGLDIRVDEIGAVSQEHLGPVRMRKEWSEVVRRAKLLQEANQEASLNPREIVEHLTKTLSAFGEGHVEAYLKKHVEGERQEGLKERVLNHGEVIKLFDTVSGEFTGLYTTKAVRAEEEQVLRLAERVVENRTGERKEAQALHSSIVEKFNFSEEQKKVFDYCLGGEQERGLRVVQGRAGTGKSYVIQAVREALVKEGRQVCGLAPTHTVVRDLKENRFEDARTIHDFLFKYKNGRIEVERGSVLLIDEAGMVGTSAFGELLKIAWQKEAQVMLFGDDRQLSSIERGGLFKVFAEKFGSIELQEVRRQEVKWQREVSEDLSQGRVREAVGLLEHHQKIKWCGDQASALSQLVEDYSRSCVEIAAKDSSVTRLVLAHRNLEVDVLNQGIQRVRQALGEVSREEYICSTLRGEGSFGVGDRLQFMKTDKTLGLVNGEFGTFMEGSSHRFKILKDTGEEISFDPILYQGLRLGYASTIYKGQGKTVDEAYVLHSPSMTENLNYVALTRQVKDLTVYVSQEETKSREQLITQMNRSENRVTSLEFSTEKQLQKHLQTSALHRMAYAVGDRVRSVVQGFTDSMPNRPFYEFEASKDIEGSPVKVRDALNKWKKEETESWGESQLAPQQSSLDNALEVPSESLSSPQVVETGTFYAQEKGQNRGEERDNNGSDSIVEDHPFREKESQEVILNKSSSSTRYSFESDHLEESLKRDAERFTKYLLGEPDLKRSNKRELFFKHEGHKLSVNIEKGMWFDFKTGEGGNLLQLIQLVKGGSFKEALEEAGSYLGHGHTHRDSVPSFSDSLKKREREEALRITEAVREEEKEDKLQRVQKAHSKSTPLEGTLGERYLREHRGIQGSLPADVRFMEKAFNGELKKEMPAVVSFMKDHRGHLTACQFIYLEEGTGRKANLEVSKKTQGVVSGSYVEIQKGQGPVYLAEGVETALSIKEAGVTGTIYASLGIHNLKNYEGSAKEVILCADNDGPTSSTSHTLEKTRATLEKNGYSVEIIKPLQEGKDFNDVLVQQGKEAVREYFQRRDEQRDQGRERFASPGSRTCLTKKEMQASEETFSQPPQSDSPGIDLSRDLERDLRQDSKDSLEASSREASSDPIYTFESLYSEYDKKLTSIYKERVNSNTKPYRKEIKWIAERAAREAYLLKECGKGPQNDQERVALLSKAHYEGHRIQELRKQFIEKDEDYFKNWMNHHFKAEVLGIFESKHYWDIRKNKEIVSKKERTEVKRLARQDFKESGSLLEKHQTEAQREYGYNGRQAQVFAQYRILFEARYGVVPKDIHLETLKQAVECGYKQYKAYESQYTKKIQENHGEVNSSAQDYIEKAASYRAHREIKEIVDHSIETKNLPAPTDLKEISKRSGKIFKDFKNEYDTRYEEQKQAEREQEKAVQQQQKNRGREMSR